MPTVIIKLPSTVIARVSSNHMVELDITPIFSMDVSRALDQLSLALQGEGYDQDEAIELVGKIDALIYKERVLLMLRNCITVS